MSLLDPLDIQFKDFYKDSPIINNYKNIKEFSIHHYRLSTNLNQALVNKLNKLNQRLSFKSFIGLSPNIF